MTNNIKKLRKAHGLTQKELADKVDVTESMISQYESGKKFPSYETLLKLGEALECQVSDILDDRKSFDFTFSALEKDLILKYRSLDETSRKVVNAVMEVEATRGMAPAQERIEKKTKIIPLFGSSFAAGSFEPGTQDDPFEDYEVDAGSKAEFAIRVSGDSMEPELHDGQIVLCTKRKPQIGEIVVCLVNDSFYVKQFITDGVNIYLRSINRKRKDADLDIWASGNYSVKCFGTVIHKKIPLVMQ